MSTPTADVSRLQSLARRHNVCYEVWPEYLPVESRKIKVGLEIDLCCVVSTDSPHYCAGCPLCEQTYADLREIAEWVQPGNVGGVTSEILAYDHALHLSRGQRARPEVVLAIHLADGHVRGAIEDRDQERILRQVRERLKAVGVEPR